MQRPQATAKIAAENGGIEARRGNIAEATVASKLLTRDGLRKRSTYATEHFVTDVLIGLRTLALSLFRWNPGYHRR
ncbi:hypothetical protein MMAR_1450 [Mycobacterium marinum M]|uniref:Uncharacterized protein n=1 Tax=Mycobacterium marinum (strain ATCC BAA-535 / M) TaxID=216594 RepID=B2HFQ8_MYCMM|nr:hypothetical protein MMAR_1450 [Mycobacterium marinum M]